MPRECHRILSAQSAVSTKTVTYDFHRMMDGATKLKCSEFGDAIIKHMAPGGPARSASEGKAPAMAGA